LKNRWSDWLMEERRCAGFYRPRRGKRTRLRWLFPLRLGGGWQVGQPSRVAPPNFLEPAARARFGAGWLTATASVCACLSRRALAHEDERVARIGLPGVPTSTWFAAGTRRLAGDYAAAPGLELGTQLGLDPRRHGHGYQNQTRAAGQGGAWALAERILCVCVCVVREDRRFFVPPILLEWYKYRCTV